MAHLIPRTIEEIFDDFKGRRAGIVRALTVDVNEFYQQCDPDKENLCLYGLPDETWEVTPPVEQVPTDLPEPSIGINFSRDGMLKREWLALVAIHCDSWLISVAFCLCARVKFGKRDRDRLFDMMNDYPSVYEVVEPRDVNQPEPVPNVIEMPSPKDESESEEEGTTLCGACGEKNDEEEEFWICCDICEIWYHGKCVRITPAEAKHIVKYKCPSCRTNKRRQD